VRHVDEFRSSSTCLRLLKQIRETASVPWVLMDVCGGQTHGLVKSGIEQTLAGVVELIHGPGCPVCVTPAEAIDFAIQLVTEENVLLATFGDMVRVPGSRQSLMQARSMGADVRVIYSPIDAVTLAQQHPDRQVVLFAVGFETTAPATALAVLQASEQRLGNFSLLVSHVRVQPAMEAILQMPDCRVQAFLAAGHVATVTGFHELGSLADRYHVPVVVTGFEPVDLLMGILDCVEQLEAGSCRVSNQYGRHVQQRGNRAAQAIVERVYQVATTPWRGFGQIVEGGLRLREPFASFDACNRFQSLAETAERDPDVCRAADVMAGRIKPKQCPEFGITCTPDAPRGAPMVSSEGACAAYYRFQNRPPQ